MFCLMALQALIRIRFIEMNDHLVFLALSPGAGGLADFAAEVGREDFNRAAHLVERERMRAPMRSASESSFTTFTRSPFGSLGEASAFGDSSK